jgi:hypothetical protein
MKKILALIVSALFLINLASAVSIENVQADTLSPGSQGNLRVGIQNEFNDDAIDLSFTLNFANTQFIALGSSEGSLEDLDSDDEETFGFRIKASNEITPGDYEIPYTLEYTLIRDEKNSTGDVIKKIRDKFTRTGGIGLRVEAQPDLSYTSSTEDGIEGKKGSITVKIVNSGFADARFVSVRILPDSYTLLSESSVYIGSVDSDDFETASFDVIFKSEDSKLVAVVEYTDFENRKLTQNINLPLNVYTNEEAIELGLIQKSNTSLYGIIAAVLLVFWLIRRSIKKRARLRRSLAANGR